MKMTALERFWDGVLDLFGNDKLNVSLWGK